MPCPWCGRNAVCGGKGCPLMASEPIDLSIPNTATRRAMAEADAGAGKRYSGTGAEIIDQILSARTPKEGWKS